MSGSADQALIQSVLILPWSPYQCPINFHNVHSRIILDPREDSPTFANIRGSSRMSVHPHECPWILANIRGYSRMSVHPRECLWILANVRGSSRMSVHPREYPLHPRESILHPREGRLDPRECLRTTLECRKPPPESIWDALESTCDQKLESLHIREGSKTTFEDVHGHSRGSTDIREDATDIRADPRILARIHGSSRMIPDILDSRQTRFASMQD